ncbi:MULTISPECIES: 50S ribosomal protein L3 [Congzhengia]|jgi:large subunit ribosomal protein L3|uniref:Large ribosomal subunit protein uL3 n=1 Tax=Congzhengia minquanensis TaxID=2763657 RepID=A0A926HTY5_9FIRM|nr:50S ribosomal protein L3 [Congzhengia minquanensis]MBC8540017.1 50S ribosomal protein L3 [Congzhengia minquanensis]MBD8947245.1 50S ribosomal protein L3 [Clostridiales bacterium]HBL81506.1 50S ribosomal protein L3 [Clostridiales bacterium]
MKKAILGKKLGMTQLFGENGVLIPVTVVEAGPCRVIQKKTVDSDGYEAVQVGFGEKKEKHTPKAMQGHFKKAGTGYMKYLRELKLDNSSEMNVGDEIKADVFAAGDAVDVTGITKGKGYAGPIKRWGAHRGPMTHGSGYHRGPGSLGACSTPSRVMKGKKLAGHLGVEKVTIQNLEVVLVDAEKNVLAIKGAIPGPKGGMVIIKDSVKA